MSAWAAAWSDDSGGPGLSERCASAGVVTTPEMRARVYRRLVAKHWVKAAKHPTRAPTNEIVFSRFTLWARQP